MESVCIRSTEDQIQKAEKWAQFLGAPLNPDPSEKFFFTVHFESERVFLLDHAGRVLEIDFDNNHLQYERKSHRGKNELIAKALGLQKGNKKILDLSVGLASDSVFLSQLGCEVCGVERSPILYLLLSEALQKTQKIYLKEYQLFFADSHSFLTSKKGSFLIDAIYFDPMYPHKKKSALPKKEMVLFRDLVGDDEDAQTVLHEALQWPVRRVVVKRPLKADPLLPGVRHSFEGKVVRYDTYVVG